MADYEVIEKYRRDNFDKTLMVLNKTSELIAFIKIYGALYDRYYNAFILNLNNINERFLETGKSEIIDRLYSVYSNAKEANKTDKEIFIQLRKVLYELPALSIMETADRAERHKPRNY